VSALPQDDTRVTCLSCHYSYPSVRGFCPICGAAAPTEEEAHSLHVLRSQPRETRREAGTVAGNALRAALASLLKKPVPIVGSAAIVLCAWLFLRTGDRSTPSVTAPATRPAEKSPALAPQPATIPENTAKPVAPTHRGLRSAAPAVGEFVVEESVAPEDNAVELWKRVRHGDTDAEVALAKLYLDGTRVSQSCEQAHLLLLAASRKKHPEAERLLSGDYAQRCR